MEKINELRYAGRGTPEFTPVETRDLPMRTNPAVETGILLRKPGENVTS
jgi:hypothetical protein